MNLQGQTLGGWQIIELLGKGGQGAIWLGVKREIDGRETKAAIKTLSGKAALDSDARRKLAHEHDMIRDLKSPYISQYLDSGITLLGDKEFPVQWIALEFVLGENLSDEVKRHGVLDESSWFELAHDGLSALALMHSKGLIHSDIKPANIMRSSRKSVVVDLGAASLVGIRDIGDIQDVLTIEYAAPEQLDGYLDAKDYGYEIDVFSFGMTLVFAATGSPAWDEVYRNSKGEVNKTSLMQHIEQMRSVPPRLTGMTSRQQALVAKMLGFYPSSRKPAAQLLKEVKEVLPEGSARKQDVVSGEPVRWIPQVSSGRTSPVANSYGMGDQSQPKWTASILLAFAYGIGAVLRLNHFNNLEIWRYPTRRAEYIVISIAAFIWTLGIAGIFQGRRWVAAGASSNYTKAAWAGVSLGPLYALGSTVGSILINANEILSAIFLAIGGVSGLLFFAVAGYVSVPPKEAL